MQVVVRARPTLEYEKPCSSCVNFPDDGASIEVNRSSLIQQCRRKSALKSPIRHQTSLFTFDAVLDCNASQVVMLGFQQSSDTENLWTTPIVQLLFQFSYFENSLTNKLPFISLIGWGLWCVWNACLGEFCTWRLSCDSVCIWPNWLRKVPYNIWVKHQPQDQTRRSFSISWPSSQSSPYVLQRSGS